MLFSCLIQCCLDNTQLSMFIPLNYSLNAKGVLTGSIVFDKNCTLWLSTNDNKGIDHIDKISRVPRLSKLGGNIHIEILRIIIRRKIARNLSLFWKTIVWIDGKWQAIIVNGIIKMHLIHPCTLHQLSNFKLAQLFLIRLCSSQKLNAKAIIHTKNEFSIICQQSIHRAKSRRLGYTLPLTMYISKQYDIVKLCVLAKTGNAPLKKMKLFLTDIIPLRNKI